MAELIRFVLLSQTGFDDGPDRNEDRVPGVKESKSRQNSL